MIQLHSIREKISWQIGLFVVLYIVAAVILLAVFLPARSKKTRLLAELTQLENTEVNLLRLVETRPALEASERALQAELLELELNTPSQYDLPGVLAVLADLSGQAGLKLDALEHVPLKLNSGNTSGMIPLTFILSGSEAVYAYVLKIQELLPSLHLTEVIFSYLGDNQFQALVRADLQVFVAEQAMASNWKAPLVKPLQRMDLKNNSFGMPFEVVAQFLGPNVQVLGVVEAGRGSSVLLSKDGVQRWYRVGERFGKAVVSSILSNGVMLDVDGVQLKLTVGG